MSNARNLSKFKPSSSGLVETADIADDAINADKIADNAVTTDRIADDAVTTAKVNPTQTDITSVGTLTSATISGDLTVDTNTLFVDASENNVGIGTTTPATSLEISGTSANTQGGVFPRIQISTTADNNPTYSGSLDIVEKQSGASSTAVFGSSQIYGFRMMLDGFNNVLKWFGGSQTTVTERMGLDRDTGNLTLNTGNLIMGTNGKGIDFSNASAPTGGSTDPAETSTATVLDDYEEGHFNPISNSVDNASGTFKGMYVKVGNLCNVSVRFSPSSASTNGHQFGIFLPFKAGSTETSGSFNTWICPMWFSSAPNGNGLNRVGTMEGNNNYINVRQQGTTSSSEITGNAMGGSFGLHFSITYRTLD